VPVRRVVGSTGVAGPFVDDERVVGMDYGHFVVDGSDSPSSEAAFAATEKLLKSALDGDVGIAGDGHRIVVISPHQCSYAMSFRVQTWAGKPVDDSGAWDEVFLASIDVAARGLVFYSPTLDPVVFAVPPGRYLVRLTGAGFAEPGTPGYDDPADRWRLQCWPAARLVRARRVRRWTRPSAGRERNWEEWAEIITGRSERWGEVGREYMRCAMRLPRAGRSPRRPD